METKDTREDLLAHKRYCGHCTASRMFNEDLPIEDCSCTCHSKDTRKEWDYLYFKEIGPLFDDDGNNVDGKVRAFIRNERQKVREETIKEIREIMGRPAKIEVDTVPFVEGKIIILRQLNDVLDKLKSSSEKEK